MVALALLVGSCADDGAVVTDPPPSTGVTTTTAVAAVEPALDAARAAWDAAGLSEYRFEFEDDCGECDRLPAREVVVWDDDVYDPERQAVTPDEAFAAIERALATGVSVEAEYDPELGYPTEVWIDRESRAVDGGTHWVFEGLSEGLPGDDATIDDLEQATDLWLLRGPASYEFRVSFICDCEVEGTLWTQVVDGLVTDWDVVFDRDNDMSVSPVTIDALLTEST